MPDRLVPVFAAAGVRYRGAYGGRGSGKTRTFAKMSAVIGTSVAQSGDTGLIVCGREYQNSLEESSFAEVKAAIMSEPFLAARYEIGEKYIRTIDKRVDFAFIGLRHSLDSLKSKAKIHLLWVDEAEHVRESAWSKIVPTVREAGSEIWVTWNRERRNSATDLRFIQHADADMAIAEINWADNPWFPDVLDRERLRDLRDRPDQYGHVWGGDYKTVVTGAYYTLHLRDAAAQGRICRVTPDPLLPIKLFCDIGGTGARSDAFAMWAGQYVGREIRVLNYYEAQGQELGHHLGWLRQQGYSPTKSEIYLPHDGATHDRVYAVSYESALKSAGYRVHVVPNQGRGAAMARIEAGRRLMCMMWFNAETTEAGRESLAWYHAKIDTQRNIDLGPDHDFSSHAADAFGLMAICYKAPTAGKSKPRIAVHRPRDRAMGY